jgi:hypothetical protein
MKIVKVKWLDHLTLDGKNISMGNIQKAKLVEEETVGFLVEEDKDCIKLVYTIEHFPIEPEYVDALVISKKMITEIKEVT